MNKDLTSAISLRQGCISLGDLVIALHVLDTCDSTTVDIIAEVLGFTGVDANPVEETHGVADAQVGTHDGGPPQPERSGPPDLTPQTPPPLPELPEQVLPTTMSEPESVSDSTAPPSWLTEPQAEVSTPSPPPRAPLFPARTAKGVLSAAVATPRSGRRLDAVGLIRSLARCEPLRELPMFREASVHRGAQLLLDTAQAMVPFLTDLDDFTESVAQVVGHNGYQVFQFSGDPTKAVRWTRSLKPHPWRPEPGRPIVLATDFGAGAPPAAKDRAPQRAWVEFINRCHEAGCPVVAFVPHAREHWPRSLSRRIALVHWHPRTRASHVRRLLGAGLKSAP